MGHAVHPNYQDKHEENHAPKMNGGVVIKTNAKQRYTSDAIGSFVVKKLVERKGGRVQEFEVRNDMCVALCLAVCHETDIAQALRLDRRTDALQDRRSHRRRRRCHPVDALHPRDRGFA